jgi:hypothetical protein
MSSHGDCFATLAMTVCRGWLSSRYRGTESTPSCTRHGDDAFSASEAISWIVLIVVGEFFYHKIHSPNNAEHTEN